MHPGAQVVKEATLQHCNVASCNRTYHEISKAAACKSVCKPVATPKVSKGRSENPLVASAEAKPCETEKARNPFSLVIHKKSISCRKPYSHQEVGPEGFQRAIGKPFGRLRRGEILRNRKSKEDLSLAIHKKSISCRKPYPHQEVGPEGFQRASGKPFGRLRRGETLQNRKSKEDLFLAIHKKPVPCERFRPPAGGRGTFPARESTQRAPGAAKGCMRHGRPRTPRC